MPVSDVLKGFRKGGYGSDKKGPENPSEKGGPRTIQLTDSEQKELQAYAKGDGAEQQCLVTGRMGGDGKFTVISVHNPGGESTMPDENEMAAAVMGKQSPMMQMQTQPSPS